MSQGTVIKTLLQSTTEVYYKVLQALQSMAEVYYKVRQVLQSVTEVYYKVSQVLQSASGITKCDKLLLQSASGITKCHSYYKVRRNKGNPFFEFDKLESKVHSYIRENNTGNKSRGISKGTL